MYSKDSRCNALSGEGFQMVHRNMMCVIFIGEATEDFLSPDDDSNTIL
jgi:hypothetical protein